MTRSDLWLETRNGYRYVFLYGVDFTIFLKEDFVKVFSLRVHVHDNANELRVENANELRVECCE